jgi:hypothetical protein
MTGQKEEKMSKIVTALFVCVIFYLMHTFAGFVPAEGKLILYGLATLASLNLVTKA